MNPYPKTHDEYIQWAEDNIGVSYTPSVRIQYRSTAALAQVTAQGHIFFQKLDDFLKRCNEEVNDEIRAPLLMSLESIQLQRKSYESALDKAFRQNVIWNENYPEEPKGGWVKPENWFEKLNDVIRGTIVCKYIDGPKLLAEKLGKFATSLGLSHSHRSQQKDEGYYAYHFYVNIPLEISGQGEEIQTISLSVELQLTTQLQEVLYDITHRFYDQTRSERQDDPSAWKWEIESNRFRAGYLAHTLHLLEAMVLELRDKPETKAPENPNEEDKLNA